MTDIARITKRPKTSVYFHIKNLPLSAEKWISIHSANRLHLLKIAALRKGKSSRGFKKFDRWDADRVALVAHLIFDGEIKRSGCMYNNRNLSLLRKVGACMRRLYSFRPVPYENPITGVHRISYFNVALGNYMKEKSEELLRDVIYFPKELKREFLKSFFDDEGCMDFRPERNHRRIRGYQKNADVLRIVQALLHDFGITSSIQAPNEVFITGKENLKRYQKEIGFSPGVRINGNRPNSIWKKSLEKRELLRRAITSFRN